MPEAETHLREALAERYAIHRELGGGGMGTVFSAEDVKHRRPVAVKVLDPELTAALGPERFLREIEISARLHHPHILPLYDSGEADGFLYYVMPQVEGESLRDRLTHEKQLPVDDALQIAREVADALNYAHSHGVVHRDIKPDNILLESGHAVVADFGIARAIGAAGGEQLTATGLAIGTPAYMSPEQAAGSKELDGRSDLYSLGCVLYEMLAGQPPFTGPTVESVVGQHLIAEPPNITSIRPSVPPSVAAALERALAKTPADRFHPVAQFGEALAAPSVAEASTAARTGLRALRQRRLAVAGLVFGIIGLLVLLLAGGPGALTWIVGADTDAPAEVHWVLMADFESPALDPTVADAVREIVGASIEQAGPFRRIPEGQVRLGRQMAEIPDTVPLTVERARHLAYRTTVPLIIDGRVTELPSDRYAVTLRATAVDDGSALGSVVGEMSKASFVNDAAQLGQRMVRVMSPGAAGADRRPRPAVLTSSFDAYRLFVEANRRNRAGEYGPAARLARQAVDMDPDFASAWLSLSVYYRNLQLPDSSSWALSEAVQRVERLGPQERLRLAVDTAPNAAERLTALDRVIEGDPWLSWPHNSRGLILHGWDRFEESLASFEQAIALSPLGPPQIYLSNRRTSLISLGRIDDARLVASQLQGSLRELAELSHAIAMNDWDEVERRARALERDPSQTLERRLRGSLTLAAATAVRGRTAEARQVLEGALPAAQALGPLHRLKVHTAQLLIHITVSGPPLGPVPLEPSDTVAPALVLGGLWAAAAGDTASALRYRDDLRSRTRDEAPGSLPLLDAVAATFVSDWEGWTEVSTAVLREDPWAIKMLSRWLTADAYELLEKPDSAAAYFERVVRSDGWPWWEHLYRGFTYASGHFRLARIYTEVQAHDRAREHYLTFLETFTDPDPDLAWMVAEARNELERLGRGR